MPGHWKCSGMDLRYELVQFYYLHQVLRGLFRSTLYLTAKSYSQQKSGIACSFLSEK